MGASDVLAVLALVVSVASAVFSYLQAKSVREQVQIERARHARETAPVLEVAAADPRSIAKRRPRRGRRPYPRLPEDAVVLTVRFLGPQPALASVEFRAQEWRLIALSRWLPVPGGPPDPRDRVKWEPVRIGGTVWLVVRSHVVTGPPRDVTLIADCVGLDGLRWTVLLRYQATGKEE